jgi:hypothetical protein
LFCFFFLHFLKCILIVQGISCISHMYVSYFNQVNPIIYSSSISPLPYYSTPCSALHFTVFTHGCIVCQYRSLSFSFLSRLPSDDDWVFSDRPTITIMFSQGA